MYSDASVSVETVGQGRIDYRDAQLTDSLEVARFLRIAGDGLYEFLFDGVIPFMTAAEFLAAGVAGEDSPISYRNCFVAVDAASGRILGAANAFPADRISSENYPLVPTDRQEHIRAMLELRDQGSMFLNALAVEQACRGAGVGTRLLRWAAARGRADGRDRLSLHVWADNTAARAFYQGHGFVEIGVAEVASHPRLEHKGGSILMSLCLSRADAVTGLNATLCGR